MRCAIWTLIASVCLGLFVALASETARAQEGEDAESLIRQGIQLRKKGDNLRAHGYFKRAYEIAHTPRSAAQLGLVEQSLDRLVEAEEHLSEALANSDAWVDEKRAILSDSLNVVHGYLGKVQITVPGGVPPSATVQINKRRASKLPADGVIWVDPGTVVLLVEAPGFGPTTKELKIDAGQSTIVDAPLAATGSIPLRAQRPEASAAINPGPAVTVSEPTPNDGASASPQGERNWKMPAKWGTAIVAIGGLGLGIIETMNYVSKVHSFNSTRDPADTTGKKPLCSDDSGMISGGSTCLNLNDGEKTAVRWAIVGYSVGAVLAVASTALFLVDRKHDADRLSLSCGPGITPDSRFFCQMLF